MHEFGTAKLFEVVDVALFKHKSISELLYSGMYVITQIRPEKLGLALLEDGDYYTGKYIGSGLYGPTFNIGLGFHKRFAYAAGWHYYSYGSSS